MSSTRLQRYALIAEIIGGAAIVISLIFVGYEVRQSSKAQRAATYQSLMQNFEVLQSPITNDAEFAEIWRRSRNEEQLTDLEKVRLRPFFGATHRHGDMAYFHYKNGALDEERLNHVIMIVVSRTKHHPYFSETWEAVKEEAFPKDYVDFVDALLEEEN